MTTSRHRPLCRPTATAAGPDGLHLRPLRRADPDARDLRVDPEQTVVNGEYRATSLLATMRERYNLGDPFSAREASARSFADIFTLTTPRPQEDWPDVVARPVPVMHESLVPLDAPLGLLGKSLLLAVLSFAQSMGNPSRHQARRHDHRRAGDLAWPGGPRRGLPAHARRRDSPEGAPWSVEITVIWASVLTLERQSGINATL